ncbi:SAM-dependent methyltransferase [Dissulfuribacter thermophilus]|uniref:SAM-dependent methyltransferase n=1 Tax=Dissulfuribacter thermophilus TaxID=1156395 RepID=A0A1B9F3Z8_9BACT|nr:class I SAM-dependent methyltransferase [Dissulfuribacter thermophilus]OCC14669.1 SAM-dependent methyltransferase [Dissulfuribacter thermophilus]
MGKVFVQNVPYCYLCGIKGQMLYTNLKDALYNGPGIWSYKCCSNCGLIWLDPRPVPAEIGKFYHNYSTHYINEYGHELNGLRRIAQHAVLAGHLGYEGLVGSPTQKLLGKILSLIPPIKERCELNVRYLNGRNKGVLLDVGCGSGGWLAKMQALGWKVVGVEPDEQAVKIASEKFGLKVYQGTLEEQKFADNIFDAVTISHVIEHVYDPIGLLKECLRVLKPKGYLVILTPNIKSLGHRFFRNSWLHLDPPRHLYLFSSDTLRACCQQVGFLIKSLHSPVRYARGTFVSSKVIQKYSRFSDELQKNMVPIF